MFFDAHTHVQFKAFESDWQAVIDRALGSGVWMAVVGTQDRTSARAVDLASRYPEGVYATVGLHPVHTERLLHEGAEIDSSAALPKGFRGRGEEFDYSRYRDLAMHPKVLAIGECGLDYYLLADGTREKQRIAFERQILLARDVQKPLMIHCRNAFSDLIHILKAHSAGLLRDAPGIVHFFTGDPAAARELLDLGFYFSFGGAITRSREYDEVLRLMPLSRLLAETDAPYMTPSPRVASRNEPLLVRDVVTRLAGVRNLAEAEMQEILWNNAMRSFRLQSEFRSAAGSA